MKEVMVRHNAMRGYAEHKNNAVKCCKRSLITADEAIQNISGYLNCLLDLGIITEDEKGELFCGAIEEIC